MMSALPALIPLGSLLPWIGNRQGEWLLFLAIVWVCWLTAAGVGALGRIPAPAAALAGWAAAMSWLTAYAFIIEDGIIPALVLIPGLCLASGLAAFQVFAGWTDKQTRLFLRALRYMMAVLVAYGWLQVFQGAVHITGSEGNATLFAALLAMAVPLWIAEKPEKRAIFALIATVGLIGRHTRSVTGVLATLLAVGWGLRWRKPWRAPLLCILAFFGIAGVLVLLRGGLPTNYLSFGGRLELWDYLLGFWWNTRPVIGMGLGIVWGLAEAWPGYVSYGWHHAHNEYLQLLVELGAVGAALFLWKLRHLCTRCLTREATALYGGMLLVSGTCAATSFTWHIPTTAVLTLFAYARACTEGA